MQHPTDRIAHTTAFVTPVVEHWLDSLSIMASSDRGARCSSVVIAFAHGAMGRRFDPSR